MSYVELDRRAVAVLKVMSGVYADLAIRDSIVPSLSRALGLKDRHTFDSVRAGFEDPFRCLRAFYSHYAFSRRGKDREVLSSAAVEALQRCCRSHSIEELLSQDDGSLIWKQFEEICVERQHRNSEQLNRGLVQGMLDLAQEVYRIDGLGSIACWVVSGIHRNSHIEAQFLRIVDIRGVGPKNTSAFLRDVVLLNDLEDNLDYANRLYIQPIDRWIRLLAEMIITEPHPADLADWVVAGKIAKYCRHAGVSGIRFNIGGSFFGSREAREVTRFPDCIDEAIRQNALEIGPSLPLP